MNEIIVTEKNIKFINYLVNKNFPTSDSKLSIQLYYLYIMSKTFKDANDRVEFIGGRIQTKALASAFGFSDSDRYILVNKFSLEPSIDFKEIEGVWYWIFNYIHFPTKGEKLIRCVVDENIQKRIIENITDHQDLIEYPLENVNVHSGDVNMAEINREVIRINMLLNNFF